MATKKKVKQEVEEPAHSADDHPELEIPEVLRELVHSLLHRVEFLEQMLAQR